ncbi:hypothetical protein BC835DRAFT_1215070, partial [Cytidiella melzeri]
DFYFNYEGSFLGRFDASQMTGYNDLGAWVFLATPLLPCGRVDGTVKKFTGNDAPGDPANQLEAAIHAFVHFSYLYSCKTKLLCDLQGAVDRSGRMCLIDPQAHTFV